MAEIWKRYDIICLMPQDKPVYFVVECGEHGYGTYEPEVRDYVFEEGTCPTSFFVDDVVAILTNSDPDPHGLFEYVRTIDAEERFAMGNDPEWWAQVLPEAFDGVAIAKLRRD